MCGRYVLTKPAKVIAEHFDLFEPPVHPMSPRYNASPTERLPVIKRDPAGHRRLEELRWGFQFAPRPDAPRPRPLINARSETVDQKPAFRDSFRGRRCLVPADGFYEWKKRGKKKSLPFWIGFADRRLFAFAALWDRDAFTILTTSPNARIEPLHDRMPVILAPEAYQRWLDPSLASREALEDLFQPFPDDQLEVVEIQAPGEPRIPV
jgi:putative SOS response-associated peptidase YedK